MTEDRFLTAQEAAAELEISLATLYAYASRGMLRSEPVPGDPRARRYPREDVLRLQEKKELRKDPEKVAPKALSWGAPVLESAITLVQEGRLYYRGRDAVALARSASVEEVAALIWTGDPAAAGAVFASAPPVLPDWAGPILAADLTPIERCQVVLPLAGAADLAAWDLRPSAIPATGGRILQFLSGIAAGVSTPPPGGLANILQAGWAPGRPEAAGPIASALILSADHELNVSAFTARCVASAGSSPYDVVSAGVAALKGARHGGHTERVEALFREAGSAAGARRALADRLRRGEAIPGCGHPLYPDGDPRGTALLELAAEVAPGSPAIECALALADASRELLREHPTIDLGLVALARALDLPEGTPLALFALGRTIGWIGHAIEQYALGRLIRPRAAYVGEMPGGVCAAESRSQGLQGLQGLQGQQGRGKRFSGLVPGP
ncbi:MAG TPA: citrate synthase family protein [Thermoanaerobaculia bacterium]|nr:citrate synthase family protein [Thermoanaerobaculia bacterium]